MKKLVLTSFFILENQRRVIHSEEDAGCSLCREDGEDVLHLFFGCSFATGVWSKIFEWLGLQFPHFHSTLDLFHWLGDAHTAEKSSKAKPILWLATCWCI